MLRLPRAHPVLAAVTLGYLLGFVIFGVAADKEQLLPYAIFTAAAMLITSLVYQRHELRAATLWGLAAWGLAHLSGGLLEVDGEVVYRLQLIPDLLRYDQAVHAIGFGFATAAVWDVMLDVAPQVSRAPAAAISALGGMGLGAINEAVEFIITRVQPNSNVGGFVNTGYDLIFNAIGCVTAGLILVRSRSASRSTTSESASPVRKGARAE